MFLLIWHCAHAEWNSLALFIVSVIKHDLAYFKIKKKTMEQNAHAELDEARKNLLLCWKCESISVMREESLSQILDCPQGLTGCWNEWLQLDEPQKPVPDSFRETVDT